MNIVERVRSMPDKFSKVLSLLEAANLIELLNKPGYFTLFAPTNKALNELPVGSFDALLEDRKRLEKLINLHITLGAVNAKQICTIKNINGNILNLECSDTESKIENIKIELPDISCTNGFIHGISEVILPTQSKIDSEELDLAFSAF